jgi:hypothetical protein
MVSKSTYIQSLRSLDERTQSVVLYVDSLERAVGNIYRALRVENRRGQSQFLAEGVLLRVATAENQSYESD